MTFGPSTLADHRARIARCRSCDAEIIWLPMPGTGRNHPVNAETVNPDDEEFVRGRHVSHFATCPQADQWRRGANKAEHVRSAGQTRPHQCHWPGCTRQVPPAKWGCGPHWFRLPQELRTMIWRAYRPGQEEDLKPSAAYLEVAAAVQAWIAEHGS